MQRHRLRSHTTLHVGCRVGSGFIPGKASVGKTLQKPNIYVNLCIYIHVNVYKRGICIHNRFIKESRKNLLLWHPSHLSPRSTERLKRQVPIVQFPILIRVGVHGHLVFRVIKVASVLLLNPPLAEIIIS